MDYKDTLLMPSTEFPMRGNLGAREKEFQLRWQQINLYFERLKLNKDNETFVIHDGPPYANGDIHTGHVLNKVLKEIMVRYKSMRGFYTPFVPGWDTHGLPIENQVTKSVNRKEMSEVEFRLKCFEYATTQVNRQREQFKRLGILADWDNPYLTMDKDFESAQIEIFGKMVEKDLVYKGLKPVHWSPSSETALAEAELEYHDKVSNSIYFSFKIVDNKKHTCLDGASLLIWTTTPWTLPANLAVSVNPSLKYLVIEVEKQKYVIGKELLYQLKTKLGWTNVRKLAEINGKNLEFVTYQHPLYDRVSPVVLSEHVTSNDGTGLVHTAPGHGDDDYIVGRKYNLEILTPVDDRGIMTNEAGKYEGEFYAKIDPLIIDDLIKAKSLVLHEEITHSYPHDWRTKQPVIFRATPQWFINLEPVKNELLDAVKKVNWVPKWGEVRIGNMMADRKDWVLSRQRRWGVPIPVFYAENGEAILDPKVIFHVSQLFKEHGSDIWYEKDAKDLLPKGYKNAHSPKGTFTKELDTMDVWFDSGTSHALLTQEKYGGKFPADLYLEGADQYRGWFNSSLTTSVIVNGVSPYKTVVSHGFLLDNHGDKMSKSAGNVIEPVKIMDQQGADILRLWVGSVDFKNDVRISDDILRQVSESYRKIRNTLRFMLGSISDFDYQNDYISYSMRDRLTQSLHVKFVQMFNQCITAYDEYNFDQVIRNVVPFVSNEISSFYLDYAKDVLYIEKAKNRNRLVIQSQIYDMTLNLLKLLNPIIPHTTSEAYWEFPNQRAKDIYLTSLNVLSTPAIHEEFSGYFDELMKIREIILKELEENRTSKVFNKSAFANVILTVTKEQKELIESFAIDFRQVFGLGKLTIKTGEKTHASATKFDGKTCARCWNVVENINQQELCPRCEQVLEE